MEKSKEGRERLGEEGMRVENGKGEARREEKWMEGLIERREAKEGGEDEVGRQRMTSGEINDRR